MTCQTDRQLASRGIVEACAPRGALHCVLGAAVSVCVILFVSVCVSVCFSVPVCLSVCLYPFVIVFV